MRGAVRADACEKVVQNLIEVAIQVLRAKFEKRVNFSRGFGFLRLLQGLGRS